MKQFQTCFDTALTISRKKTLFNISTTRLKVKHFHSSDHVKSWVVLRWKKETCWVFCLQCRTVAEIFSGNILAFSQDGQHQQKTWLAAVSTAFPYGYDIAFFVILCHENSICKLKQFYRAWTETSLFTSLLSQPQRTVRSSRSLLVTRLVKPSAFRLPSQNMLSSLFTSFVSLLWMHSSALTSFLRCGAHNSTQYSRQDHTSGKCERITSFDQLCLMHTTLSHSWTTCPRRVLWGAVLKALLKSRKISAAFLSSTKWVFLS